MEEQLRSIVARLPAWADASDLKVERIAGLTNANYRVTVHGEPYVLRLSGGNTERLGIDRDREVAALRAAAAAGLAPSRWPSSRRRDTWPPVGSTAATGRRPSSARPGTSAC